MTLRTVQAEQRGSREECSKPQSLQVATGIVYTGSAEFRLTWLWPGDSAYQEGAV
jgi:hypothetical protein